MTTVSDDLVRALVMNRLSSDPGMRDLLPLLGIPPSAETSAASETAAHSHEANLAADRTAVYRGVAGVDAELRRCHALLDRLAESLGACAHCLGIEPGCAYCGGGSPSQPAAPHLEEKETTP